MKFSWLTDIWLAIQGLGGEASLQQIYRSIQRSREQHLPEHFESLIRAELQHYCADAKQYQRGYPNLFKHTGRGRWAIRSVTEKISPELPHEDMQRLAFACVCVNPAELEGLQNAAKVSPAAVSAYFDEMTEKIRRENSEGKIREDFERMIRAGIARPKESIAACPQT